MHKVTLKFYTQLPSGVSTEVDWALSLNFDLSFIYFHTLCKWAVKALSLARLNQNVICRLISLPNSMKKNLSVQQMDHMTLM